MGIKANDLKDTMLGKVVIDTFEPKTGESKDVIVVGFNTVDEKVGEDVYNFLNTGVTEIRDVEVSPNPNPDGYYMVFVEINRDEKSLDTIKEICTDLNNIAGNMKWTGQTHLTDDFHGILNDDINTWLITDPENYMTKDEWIANAEAEEAAEAERTQEFESAILEFARQSALNVDLAENIITMTDARNNTARLEVVGFGSANDTMADIGISESAIKPLDSTLRQFNSMLGEMRAIPIDNYIVIFREGADNILVTKLCSDS